MSEFSTQEVVKHLSKAAHLEENKGHLQQAGDLYKAVVTLEEMAHFPAAQIRQAKKDAAKCEDKIIEQRIEKALESYPSPYDLTIPHPSHGNDNGLFRKQPDVQEKKLPYLENDNGLFRNLPYRENDNGLFRRQKPNLMEIPEASKLYEI